jgi:hypothetical protein
MMSLRMPGASIRWPEECACCLAPMMHTVTAAKTKSLYLGVATVRRTMTISVPYCEPCSRHAVWAAGSRYAGIVLRVFLVLVLGPMLGTLVSISLPEDAQTAAFVLLGLVLPVLVAIAVGVHLCRRVPRISGPSHATRGQAVEVSDFSKEAVTLRVYNEEYGRSLAAANGAALTYQGGERV